MGLGLTTAILINKSCDPVPAPLGYDLRVSCHACEQAKARPKESIQQWFILWSEVRGSVLLWAWGSLESWDVLHGQRHRQCTCRSATTLASEAVPRKDMTIFWRLQARTILVSRLFSQNSS